MFTELTRRQVRAVLARLGRSEKDMLRRLPPNEAARIVEVHHYFPGAELVDPAPEPEQDEQLDFLAPQDPTTKARSGDPSTAKRAALARAHREEILA